MNHLEKVLDCYEKQKFRTEDKVVITRIEDMDDADHLTCYVGKIGIISSWIMNNIVDKVIKFKVKFENGDTAYFLGSEMDKISE
jgi:hypothetical protein